MKARKVVGIWLLSLVIVGAGPPPARTQDSFTRDIIDTPTAGILPRGNYMVGIRAYPEGGILGLVGVGLLDRLEIGLSFGGTNIIGEGDVDWNPRLEYSGRYRLLDETLGMPALALGFDSQGWGRYDRAAHRYEIKSRGFYGVLSKNYSFLGQLGVHLGANLSLEGEGKDEHRPNLFFGLHKTLNPDLYLVAEYDLPITGNSVADDIDSGVGFINAGVRFLIDEHLFIELDLRNLNRNAKDSDRTLRMVYNNTF